MVIIQKIAAVLCRYVHKTLFHKLHCLQNFQMNYQMQYNELEYYLINQ